MKKRRGVLFKMLDSQEELAESMWALVEGFYSPNQLYRYITLECPSIGKSLQCFAGRTYIKNGIEIRPSSIAPITTMGRTQPSVNTGS